MLRIVKKDVNFDFVARFKKFSMISVGVVIGSIIAPIFLTQHKIVDVYLLKQM